MSLLAFMLLWSFRACTYDPPDPSPSWITILSNIFIGIDWGSKAMREQTGCFCEEKVNEMSYKRWDFFQAAQVAAADAMLKQSSLMGTLTQLSLICWFAECIGCIFTMLWCYWYISVCCFCSFCMRTSLPAASSIQSVSDAVNITMSTTTALWWRLSSSLAAFFYVSTYRAGSILTHLK